MKRLLVINGPNLNLLGQREPEIYGAQSYGDLVRLIETTVKEAGLEAEYFQSNSEAPL